MLRKDRWPFTPASLNEILDSEMLAVIQAGCSARIGRAMAIVDATIEQGTTRIDPINLKEKFAPFCALLRDEQVVRGGNAACEQCDIGVAKAALSNERHILFRTYHCHMGVVDARHIIKVHDQPVAILFAGQYRPDGGINAIQANIAALGTGKFAKLIPLHDNVKSALLARADALEPVPPDFPARLQREANHVQRIAEDAYERRKSVWEHEFLDRLRNFDGFVDTRDLTQIRRATERLLQEVRTFCRSEYVVFFANIQETESVLTPIAQTGLPAQVQHKLPHFNWKKGNLPFDAISLKEVDFVQQHTTLQKGLRGDNSDYFAGVQCIVPVILSKFYRGVLLFGPFAEPVQVERERYFLTELSHLIGWFVLTELQILNLLQQQKQWESTAKLLTHQVRTALTPITTQIGTAKLLLQKPQTDPITKLITNSLKGAHELCLRLGKTVSETVASHVLLLEPEDLKFETYPLSVLVANCAEGFVQDAQNRQRQLIIEESVEWMPQAEIDIARLTIALSNLVENAVKYAYPNTKIYVRAISQPAQRIDLENVTLEIQNDGNEIASEQQERIFEQGERGLLGAKLRRIPGSGLGLWEARAVIEAHGGMIGVRSQQMNFHYRQDRAHRVIFTVKIPLRQKKT